MQDVSFRVAPGDKIGLVGRNGAWKTTLTKILAGDSLPAAGAVHASGTVGYLPQSTCARSRRCAPGPSPRSPPRSSRREDAGERRHRRLWPARRLGGALPGRGRVRRRASASTPTRTPPAHWPASWAGRRLARGRAGLRRRHLRDAGHRAGGARGRPAPRPAPQHARRRRPGQGRGGDGRRRQRAELFCDEWPQACARRRADRRGRGRPRRPATDVTELGAVHDRRRGRPRSTRGGHAVRLDRPGDPGPGHLPGGAGSTPGGRDLRGRPALIDRRFVGVRPIKGAIDALRRPLQRDVAVLALGPRAALGLQRLSAVITFGRVSCGTITSSM